MARISTVLRQWCGTCQLITQSWMDLDGDLRCTGCDPESAKQPGYGVKDWTEDDNW
jgi:hypothetical protein